MQCNTCGTLLPPGATFCPKCGTLTSSSLDYDVVPYIETHVHNEPLVLPAQPISSTAIQQPLLPADPGKYPEQKRLQSQSIPGWMTALIILLALLLIVGGIGSIIYATNNRPAELHAQATTVARNFLTAQVQSATQTGAHAMATANAMTPEQVYQQATSGTPIINDPLKDDSGNVWYHYGEKNDDRCIFRAGAYHAQTSKGSAVCVGAGTMFHNLAFQAQVTIIKGQVAGLMFRTTTVASYIFFISTNGYYALGIFIQQRTKILKEGLSSAIVTGLNQPNLLTIIARGSHIYLYINGQPIDNLIDTTYTSGQIAFLSSGNGPDSLDTAFSNAKVWIL